MSEVNTMATAAGRNIKIFGIVTLILGVLAIFAPFFTGLGVAMVVGALVLVGGIFRLVWAFHSRTFGEGIFMFVIGSLTLLCGLMMLANPLFAAEVLTILLAVYFLLEGISELIVAAQTKTGRARGWVLLDGILSILLGLMVASQYPVAGPWVIGLLLGIKLIFIGSIMLAVGNNAMHIGEDATVLETTGTQV